MLGATDSGLRYLTSVGPDMRYQYQALYVQDNFRFSPKLTLNVGLRYDVPLAGYDNNDTLSSFDPNLANPAAGGIKGALAYGGKGTGHNGRKRFGNTDWSEIGPRIGFAYAVNSKTVAHRQIPLGGGGCHGVEYVEGKLWIAALRLRGILRVDAKTWEPEFMIPYSVPRAHGTAFVKDGIWMVTGDDQGAGLIKYDVETGRALETVRFSDSDPDPHGLAWHDGALYSCDAGIHPGWPENKSPTHSYIFRIDLL